MFPVIEHLDEVFEAINGREEFMAHRNDELGFVSILYRYVLADTFLDPNEIGIEEAERRRRQLVRECRGITLSSSGRRKGTETLCAGRRYESPYAFIGRGRGMVQKPWFAGAGKDNP